MNGTLYLFPTPIGENETYNSTPAINGAILNLCDCFIVEELPTVRRFLRKAGYKKSFDDVTFFELNEHTNLNEIDAYLQPLFAGRNVGVLSEAGLPCVADPGWQIVRLAHRNHIKVVPLVGASSLMLALMASGFCGQNFAFVGYLPIPAQSRRQAIIQLEQLAERTGQTQIFIEAPYRNNKLLEALEATLKKETMLCVACDLMLPTEQIISQPIGKWQQQTISFHKRNSVFLISSPTF
ncbi:MAG: SAM-dependent methyltransferase [Bacteroidales bacterium]|jgi:16S rRNA (cytidine1402-2'-O)-methyltransferase|nr:SAM-dependent methyltransferase [Bacteroidales bacterium]